MKFWLQWRFRMKEPENLRTAILERLSQIIDPETGVDVIRMRLIEDLIVDENGRVSYVFHPSSPLCPIAISLAFTIKNAVAEVEGVIEQEIKVVDFALSKELTTWLIKGNKKL